MDFQILDSIPDLSTTKSFTDRYFSKRYIKNYGGIQNNDLMLMFHSNRIMLLSLAPSHFFFKSSKKYRINFSIGTVDRLQNSVKGKGKKGGQYLEKNSTICEVFDDETSFKVPSCVKGTLIEINESLVEHPELLREMPDSDGFIAIILSSIKVSESTKNELLTHEDYMSLIRNKDSC
ncbi:protein Abitram [Ostrinia nubilalis]|uniref:protein Abitram n=1 Tax=Ostrinia nubilalis TaxID=29057 RepID=UPI0030825682